jgi:tetratricopeptide (TPR) repeat protein
MVVQHPNWLTRLVLPLAVIFCALNIQAQDGPKVGLRILDVNPNSLAQQAGLQATDIIVKYGDVPVLDAASYFVARDQYLKPSGTKVEVDYWRGNQRSTAIVSSGTLGIRFSEYNPAAFQLEAVMQRLNAAIEVTPNPANPAPNVLNQSRDRLVADVEAAIDKAAADGLLTPAQLLVARISAVPDDGPPAAIEKQAELLKELISTQPRSFTDYLGNEVFFRHKRYRAAVPCFKRTLEASPLDPNTRLNLGIAYSNLNMFAEAETAADYALKESNLNQHGYVVAFQVKAGAALGLREFGKAVNYAEQGFNLSGGSPYLMLLWELAAAQTGDLDKFYEATAAIEKKLPKESAESRPFTDVVEAYVLSKNGQFDKAQALVRKSNGNPLNATYWRRYPTGDEIVKVWKQLQGQ